MIKWPATFTNKKYGDWYERLITVASTRMAPANTYIETHHIIPRCMHGINSKDNLVNLTAREHYVAHILLWKMNFEHPYSRKLTYAANAMMMTSNPGRDYKITSRMYEKLRSELAKLQTGEGNHFYGKKHSAETKQKFAEYHNDPVIKKAKSDRVKGDKNPAKAPAVRDKISKVQVARMAKHKELGVGSYSDSCRQKHSENAKGSNNARAKKFKFTDKDNNVYIIDGGLVNFCKEHTISTGWAWEFLKGTRSDSFNGWTVKDLSGESRTAVHKNDQQKFAKSSELDQLLSDGWIIGTKPRTKRKATPEEIIASTNKRKETLAKNRANGIFLSTKGRPRNPESVKKGVEKRMAKMQAPGYVNPAKGKKRTPEQIAKILATKRANGGFKGMSGALNPMYGKPRSEETKAKIRATKLANKLAKLNAQPIL